MPVFSYRCLRWILTVPGRMPNSRAISLLVKPCSTTEDLSLAGGRSDRRPDRRGPPENRILHPHRPGATERRQATLQGVGAGLQDHDIGPPPARSAGLRLRSSGAPDDDRRRGLADVGQEPSAARPLTPIPLSASRTWGLRCAIRIACRGRQDHRNSRSGQPASRAEPFRRDSCVSQTPSLGTMGRSVMWLYKRQPAGGRVKF